MGKLLPCGHPVECVGGAPDFEGDSRATTQYCKMCELEGRLEASEKEAVEQAERLIGIVKYLQDVVGDCEACPCGSGLKFKFCCKEKYET